MGPRPGAWLRRRNGAGARARLNARLDRAQERLLAPRCTGGSRPALAEPIEKERRVSRLLNLSCKRPRSTPESRGVACSINRQRLAGTRRVRQLEHARARAGTGDTLNRPDLQRKRDRECPAVYADTASELPCKEGVDGSSPSVGLHKSPTNRHMTLPAMARFRPFAGYETGTFWDSRARATYRDAARDVLERVDRDYRLGKFLQTQISCCPCWREGDYLLR
jgi:hypothetical protein